MQRDGVALVKFLKWLEDAVPTGRETEISIDKSYMLFGLHNHFTWAKALIRLPAIKNMEP